MAAAVTLEELRLYCRVDQSEENDALLSSLEGAAEAYLRANGGADPDSMTEDELEVYRLTVKAMVLAWYDDPAGEKSPVGVRGLINSVKTYTV